MKWHQFSRRAPGWHPLAVLWSWTLSTFVPWIVFKTLYRVRVIGQHKVPPTGPIIYVANHQSHFDPLLAGLLVWDRPFRSIARASLFNFKPFGQFLRLYGALPLQRGRGDKGTLQLALKVLEEGSCVLMFPEGARTLDGGMQEFQRGVTLLIKRAEATVLPIAIEGAYDIWPRARALPHLTGRMLVQAAEPIHTSQLRSLPPDEMLAYLQRTVDDTRMELRQVLRRQTGGRYPAASGGDSSVTTNEQ